MYSEKRLVRISQVATFNNRIPDTMFKLREAEETHVILELYAWLANRFENAFCDLEIVKRQIAKNSILIQEGLRRLTREARSQLRQGRPRRELEEEPELQSEETVST